MKARDRQKAESRAALLRAAATSIREKGAASTGIHEVSVAAGRTPGAFYGHFVDKDELVVEAFSLAMMESLAWLDEAAAGAADPLAAVIARYLGPAHRDARADGCPLPPILGEGAGANALPPDLLAQAVQDFVEHVAAAGGRGEAVALAVLLVGGQIVARATAGTPLSDEVLAACSAAAARLARTP